MVLDTRTVASLYDLAGVVRDYTTPSRGSPALDREQENQACLLRWTQGWHARHIAEAMGLADARNTETWVENIMDALVGCTTRSDWSAQNRFLRNTNTPAGLAQDTVTGTNLHGEFRRTARQNAIIQAVLSPEIRRGGQITAKAGKNKNSTELAAQANQVLQREIRQGHYPGITFGKLIPQQITALLAEVGDLIDWPGKGKSLGIRELPKEERDRIDAEIIKRCTEQAKLTPNSPPYGFYARVEDEVYRTTECCGPDGKETMEGFGYQPFTTSYANRLCLEKEIFKGAPSVQEQIADLENQQAVKDAIAAADGDANIRRLAEATGLSQEVVSGILDVLGYVPVAVEIAAIRAIILPLHDDKKLTPPQMWDESKELQTILPDRRTGIIRIRGILASSPPKIPGGPPRVPWTAATQRAERRIPLVASQLKGVFLSYLRDRDQQWLERVRGNVRRVASATEITPWSVEELATAMQETPEFMGRVIALLATETPQLVAISEGARGRQVIVIPPSGLRWILGGGETVEGDLG